MKKEILTEEEEKLMDEIAQRYIKNGLSRLEMDELKLRRGIDFIYQLADLKSPEIVICSSPYDLFSAAEARGAEFKKGETFDYFGTGYDSNWTAYGDFFKQIGIDFNGIPFNEWLEFMESGVWATLLFENAAFVCPGPSEIHLTQAGDLHNSTGSAIGWEDGFNLYFLNGVAVKKELVTTPAEKIDPHIVLKEKNAEVRREIVRKIGVERIALKLGAESLDKQNDYELLNLNLGDGRKRPYLKMKNPSIGTWHLEGVPPEIKTIHEALEWRNQSETEPTVLT